MNFQYICQNCKRDLDPSDRFCMSCGTDTQIIGSENCPNCNQNKSLKDKFCIKCGYSFQANDQGDEADKTKTNITDPSDKTSNEIEPSPSLIDQVMTQRFKELEKIQFCINLLNQDEFDNDQTAQTLKNHLSDRIDGIQNELTDLVINRISEIENTKTYIDTSDRIDYFLAFIDGQIEIDKNTLKQSKVDGLLRRLRPDIKDNLDRALDQNRSQNLNAINQETESEEKVSYSKPSLPKVNWNNLFSAISSENAMSAFLSFGVLLIALSSLVIVVSLWSQFSWIIKQSVFVLQMVGFISAGHIVKERLKLRISGLALISIGAIWSFFNAGIAVYEFVGSQGVQVIPGLGLPIDLPIYGWLIISTISLPVWLILTHTYRGHLLTQGSVGIIGVCLCLSLLSFGLAWYWSLLALTVESLVLVVFWNRLTNIYSYIAHPLIWTAHILAVVPTIVSVPVWLIESSGYSLIASMTGLAILLYLAMRQLEFYWYRYPIVGLGSVSFVLLALQSGFVDMEYFDLILTVTAAILFILGNVFKQLGFSHLDSKQQYLNPFNLAMLIFLIAALLWPDINYWARSFTALFTTIIAMVIAYSWKREPWPWIPLIPFTVLPYVLFEATAFTDVWLVTFLAVFSLLGLLIASAVNMTRNLSLPWHIWSTLLILASFSYSLAGNEYDMAFNLVTIAILLTCNSVLITKLPLSGSHYISNIIWKIDNYQESQFFKDRIKPASIVRFWSVFLATLAISIFPFGISNGLTSVEYFDQSIARDTYILISWAVIVVFISVVLLGKVSYLHRIGGFIASGIIASAGFLLSLSASDPIPVFVASYGIFLISILYRIFTSKYLFSWVATVCSGIAIISTFQLFSPISQEFIAPLMAIVALIYLLSAWVLRKNEIDAYPALLASTIILISIVINLPAWKTTAGLSCLLLSATYFVILGLLIFQQISSCEICGKIQDRTDDKFCIVCGKSYIRGSYRLLLSFTNTKQLFLGSSISISLGIFLVVSSILSFISRLGFSFDLQAYALMMMAFIVLITSILLDAVFKAIYMRCLQVVATIVVFCSILFAWIYGSDTSLIVTYLTTALYAMVFRIRFSHFLPIVSCLFFLALGIYEILYLLEFLNIVETALWCSFSLILFVIGYYIERKSLQDAISFYIFSSIFILIALWFARFDQESILISLGFLILSLISIGILIEKDRIKAIKMLSIGFQSMGIKPAYTPKSISVLISITLVCIAIPIWTITFLDNFYSFSLFTHGSLVISFYSLAFILLAVYLGRFNSLYSLPLQLSSIIASIIAPIVAIEDEIFRTSAIWASTISFAFSALIFKRFYWIYGASIAGHIGLISTVEIDYFAFSLHEKGLILGLFGILFSFFVLSIIKRFELTIHPVKQIDYKAIPLIIFVGLDLLAGLIIAGWNDWSNWELLTLGLMSMVLTAGLSVISKNIYLSYTSTFLITVNIGIIAGMLSGGPTIRAVGWSIQGLFMWWLGIGISKWILPESIKFWETPFKTSGNRLCWFATGYVMMVLLLGLTDTIRIDIALGQITMVIAILGLLYLGMSLYYRNYLYSYIAAASLIVSWYVQLIDRDILYLQLYCLPVGIYLLGLSYFEKTRGRNHNGITIILAFLAIGLLIGSAFIQSLLSEPKMFYVILVALEAVLLVILGSFTKSRLPFISGIVAFILNIGYQITSILASLGTAIFALIIGIAIVILVIILERFREKLIRSSRLLSTDQNEWTW